VLKPFKQPVGFQEKYAVASLHRNQVRLPCGFAVLYASVRNALLWEAVGRFRQIKKDFHAIKIKRPGLVLRYPETEMPKRQIVMVSAPYAAHGKK